MTVNLRMGDLMLIGPQAPSPPLMKAMAVIANALHPAFAADPRVIPGISRKSCVLCSLTVRDFLIGIGLPAAVRPVKFVVRAGEGDTELHSAGIGFAPRGEHPTIMLPHPDRWSGHLVVECDRWLIDTTLYPVQDRPAWRGILTGMIAVSQTMVEQINIGGLRPLAHATVEEYEYWLAFVWLDDPDNTTWQHGPDTRPDRRATVVDYMRSLWRDA